MKIGVIIFPTEYSIRPDDLAIAVEERGLESLFFPEHTHIPASRRSPWPGGPNLPKEYSHTHDLFVALATAAAVTKRIKVGSGICLLVEHDPIELAKTVASLDVLSRGRLVFGIGGGWNAEEMENHGTTFKTRWKLLRERVEAMKAIWANENAEYHGELVNFDPIWSYPKPVQRPHPPILLGGHGPQMFRRIARYADGWMPIPQRATNLAGDLAEIRRLMEEAGRDPRALSISVFGAAADEKTLAGYEALGVERVIFYLPSEPADVVLPKLDKYAKLAR